ncbi:MAG TPA: 2-C-methyl-D-erythritol 4-phosphate cytidylyltransferase [Flavisolibacter sp.]|nr:2-C-methyl-D-erythritol 4-phosphate cytidylyltransferase [Flavisolibacter sp.]
MLFYSIAMTKYAIIVAGGSGNRMGSAVPKQFLLLHHKPVLYYTIKTFLEAYDDMNLVLVLPEEYADLGREIIDAYFDYNRIQITSGGETRFHSVQNGLRLVHGDAIIFVHDAVRCLVSTGLIQRCYQHALQMGSAVPVTMAKDSVRLLNEELNDNEVIDRNKIVLVQTPQTFHSRILQPAFEIDFKERFTDEATVVEAYGLKISLIEGEENNIKITRPIDLLIAEKLLEASVKEGISG